MDFQQVVARRRMVRAFDPDRAVAASALERILSNAQRAPSAGFAQGSAYVVLRTEAERERFWASTSGTRPPNDWLRRMRQAPVLVLCWCSEQIYHERYAEADKRYVEALSAPYWYVDAGMGVLLMLQTAVDQGLGACLFGVPPQRVDAVRDEFAVPVGWMPVGVVAIGYADPAAAAAAGSSGSRRDRRRPWEVIHMGSWGSGYEPFPPSPEE